MNLFDTGRSLKHDFSVGRDEVRARTRAEFLAAAGVGFTVLEGNGVDLGDDDLDMLAAAGSLDQLQKRQEDMPLM